MPAPTCWSRRPRNGMQGSVLTPSYGRSSRFGHEADHLVARPIDPNTKMAGASVCHEIAGAPRRNRTGDTSLTIDAPVVRDTLRHSTYPHDCAGQTCGRGLGT